MAAWPSGRRRAAVAARRCAHSFRRGKSTKKERAAPCAARRKTRVPRPRLRCKLIAPPFAIRKIMVTFASQTHAAMNHSHEQFAGLLTQPHDRLSARTDTQGLFFRSASASVLPAGCAAPALVAPCRAASCRGVRRAACISSALRISRLPRPVAVAASA